MINIGKPVLVIVVCIHFLLVGCTSTKEDFVQLMNYPLDSTEGIITRTNISVDKNISSSP